MISTPELAPILVAPASTIVCKSSKLRIPPEAFTSSADPTVSLINLTASTVAPPVEKPVEVFTKFAPASF